MAEQPYRVLRRQVMTLGAGLPTETKQTLITYVTKDLPPYTLFLPGDKVSPEDERKAVLVSIEAREAERIGR